MEKEEKSVTILNFECYDCQAKTGQLITSDTQDEDDVKCPNCGSKNCTYSTLLK